MPYSHVSGNIDESAFTPEQQEHLKRYRQAYIRAKVIFPLISLTGFAFATRNIRDIAEKMKMDPNLVTLLMALRYGLSGLRWSEYFYPWAVTPWNRAVNRMLASGLVSGAQSLINYLIGPPVWFGEKSVAYIEEQKKNMLANTLRDMFLGAAFAPVSGAFIDWLRYGSRLSPIPEPPQIPTTGLVGPIVILPPRTSHSEYIYGYMNEPKTAKKSAQTRRGNYYLNWLSALYKKHRQDQ